MSSSDFTFDLRLLFLTFLLLIISDYSNVSQSVFIRLVHTCSIFHWLYLVVQAKGRLPFLKYLFRFDLTEILGLTLFISCSKVVRLEFFHIRKIYDVLLTKLLNLFKCFTSRSLSKHYIELDGRNRERNMQVVLGVKWIDQQTCLQRSQRISSRYSPSEVSSG